MNLSVFDKHKSRRSFDRAATGYDQNAQLQQQVASNLSFELKEHTANLHPLTVLDLGCGTGQVTESMRDRYQQAEVVALDFSSGSGH